MINKSDLIFIASDSTKHISGVTKENRIYKRFEEVSNANNIFVRYSTKLLKIDIDDYNHKTGEPEGFIKGKPRSEIVMEILDAFNVTYIAIQTDNGVHIYMVLPDDFPINSNKDWINVLGIRVEYKFPESDDHMCIKRKGRMLSVIKGDLWSTQPDPVPKFLYPLQKSKDKPFNMNFSEGDRTQPLGGYTRHLVGCKGFSTEDAFQIVQIINDFTFDNPIKQKILETQILNESTFQKCMEDEVERQEKNLTQVQVGEEVISQFGIITCKNQMYAYENGVYLPLEKDEIGSYIRKLHPGIKTSFKNEVMDYISDITFRKAIYEEKDLINVKNGFLKISLDGTVELLPHTKEYISFRQFNAYYDPNLKSKLLQSTLYKFFDGDSEQLELFKQILGYLLMNDTIYGKCFFFVGLPSSGKSQILNMVRVFCGKRNVSNLSLNAFDDKYRPAAIVDKIANINADLEKAKIRSTGNFKSLVTGDAITLERKYEHSFSYVSTAKLIFATNQYPDFSNDPEGIARRIVIIPCNHVFSRNDADFNPKIGYELTQDDTLSALLNMAIEGYISLNRNQGFTNTSKTEEAGKQFKLETNNVLRWIDEAEITEEKLLNEPIKLDFCGLYLDYQAFCVNAGEEAKAQRDFSATIKQEYNFDTKNKRIPGTTKRCQFFIRK